MTPVLAPKGLPQPFTPTVGFHNNPTTPNYFFGLKPARSPHFAVQTSNNSGGNNFMCPSPKVHLGHLPLHSQQGLLPQALPRQTNQGLTPNTSQILRRASLN